MDEAICQDFVHCMWDFLKENIHCIILYGLVARGDDTVESDIDLSKYRYDIAREDLEASKLLFHEGKYKRLFAKKVGCESMTALDALIE